jgi:hypothetical protein
MLILSPDCSLGADTTIAEAEELGMPRGMRDSLAPGGPVRASAIFPGHPGVYGWEWFKGETQ